MTSPSLKNRPTTRWSTLRARCSRAVRALLLGVAVGASLPDAALAQSGWDRAPAQRTQIPYRNRTADYQVEQVQSSAPVNVWDGYHTTWTSVDAQGRPTRRPSAQQPASQPIDIRQPAQRTSIAPQTRRQPTIVPLPEAVIRSGVDASRPEPINAASILRGGAAPTRRQTSQQQTPPTAAGFARLVLSPAGPSTATMRTQPAPHVGQDASLSQPMGRVETQGRSMRPGRLQYERQADRLNSDPRESPSLDAQPFPAARPFPQGGAQTISHEEEKAYPLFADRFASELRSFKTTNSDGGSIWNRADNAATDYDLARGDVLLAPPSHSEEQQPDPRDHREGVVMLDGLDAVMNPDAPIDDPYVPIPLSRIRPYHNYSPEGATLCPDPEGRCPEIKELPESWDLAHRNFPHLDMLWVPSNVFYSPLYFEDPALERYGHTHGPLLQPVASVTRFAAQLAGLPYQMAIDPPHRRVYPLGFYRPGECAPKQVPNIPLNAEAAVKAGAVYTGLIFAFP